MAIAFDYHTARTVRNPLVAVDAFDAASVSTRSHPATFSRGVRRFLLVLALCSAVCAVGFLAKVAWEPAQGNTAVSVGTVTVAPGDSFADIATALNPERASELEAALRQINYVGELEGGETLLIPAGFGVARKG